MANLYRSFLEPRNRSRRSNYIRNAQVDIQPYYYANYHSEESLDYLEQLQRHSNRLLDDIFQGSMAAPYIPAPRVTEVDFTNDIQSNFSHIVEHPSSEFFSQEQVDSFSFGNRNISVNTATRWTPDWQNAPEEILSQRLLSRSPNFFNPDRGSNLLNLDERAGRYYYNTPVEPTYPPEAFSFDRELRLDSNRPFGVPSMDELIRSHQPVRYGKGDTLLLGRNSKVVFYKDSIFSSFHLNPENRIAVKFVSWLEEDSSEWSKFSPYARENIAIGEITNPQQVHDYARFVWFYTSDAILVSRKDRTKEEQKELVPKNPGLPEI